MILNLYYNKYMEGFTQSLQNKPEVEATIRDVSVFGDFLMAAKSNLSGAEKANQIGVSRGLIIRWEAGESFPGEDKLPKIAEVYGVDLGELEHKFRISKKARELEKESKKAPKFRKENHWIR